MTSSVGELKRAVDNAWDDADQAVEEATSAIVADHSARGLFRSGGTIRRVIRAAEAAATGAVLIGRAAIANQNSVVLRVKLAEFQTARVQGFTAGIENRFMDVGLGDKAGRILLGEAIGRATRPEPILNKSSKGKALATWMRTALAYLGDKIVVAILVGVAIAAITAFLKLT